MEYEINNNAQLFVILENHDHIQTDGTLCQNNAMPMFGGAWNSDISVKIDTWLKRGVF